MLILAEVNHWVISLSEDDTVPLSVNPVGSSYTFTLSFLSITAGISKYDISRKHCFFQRAETRITCIKAPAYVGSKPNAPTIRKTCRDSHIQYTSCWHESSQLSHWTHVHHFVVHASRTGGRLLSAFVSCRKHASVLLRTVSYRHSCAA